jgi:hypothetical protein
MENAEEVFQETEEAIQPDIAEQPESSESDDVESILEDADAPEELEPEYVEIEYDGNTYNVPPELKDAVMRQSDYTQKTQHVAKEREALENHVREFQQAAQIHQQNMQGHAQLAAIRNELNRYSQVDWQSYSEAEPENAQKDFMAYTQLRDADRNLSTQLQQQEAQALQQQQSLIARQLEQSRAQLARDIPGWSDGVEQKLIDYAVQHGAPKRAVQEAIAQPYQIQLLYKAYQYDQSMKKAAQQPKQAVTPTKRVRGKSQPSKDPDKMSTADWLEWRNKQIRSR